MITLRPYQAKLEDDIRKAYLSGARAVLAVLPTGGGKTYTFSSVAYKTDLRNKSAWAIAHRHNLIKQISMSFTACGIKHGIVKAGYTPDYGSRVQVASIQSLIKRTDNLKDPDLIIIDECHHSPSASYKAIVDRYPNARILGVTATPARTDGKGLGEIFQSMVQGPTVSELMDMGYLCRYKLVGPAKSMDLTGVPIVGGDFAAQVLDSRPERSRVIGDAVETWMRVAKGKRTIVFCVSIKDAEHTAALFSDTGYKFKAVHGQLKDDEISRILTDISTGALDGITSCDLVSEGTDIPALECEVDLAPTQSLVKHIQKTGRVLRIDLGNPNKVAIIIDHAENYLRNMLLPDMTPEWSLAGVKQGKKASGERSIAVRQCGSCYFVHKPAPICPECGYVYPLKPREVEKEAGEMAEVDLEEARKRMQRMEQGKARSYDELLKIEKANGYKKGWASHVWNGRKQKIK